MARPKSKKAGSQELLEQKDTSNHVFQRDKLKNDFAIKIKHDLNEKQVAMLNLIKEKGTQIMFINGPAGTSKSYISVLAGLQLLLEKRVSDITYLRTVVESSSHGLGYLAGDLEQKVGVYLEPLYEKLREFIDKPVIDNLLAEQRIEGRPINFLRGSSWNVKYIILDEAQNATFKELLTVMTRVGKFSKLVIIGDAMQADIKNSGFTQMMDIFDTEDARNNGIYQVTLNNSDIVRSGVVQFIITEIERYHKDKVQGIK